MLKVPYTIVYNLRKSFYWIDSDAFMTQLTHVKLAAITLKKLKRVLHTFIKLHRFISNPFKFKHLTDGRIEGFNNRITVLNRISYDYRNFQKFRRKLLLTNGPNLNELLITRASYGLIG